jgi:hypothetical protein
MHRKTRGALAALKLGFKEDKSLGETFASTKNGWAAGAKRSGILFCGRERVCVCVCIYIYMIICMYIYILAPNTAGLLVPSAQAY